MNLNQTYKSTELDGQCSICRERKVSAYRMYASCGNCSTKVVAILSKGHEAHHLTAECPACGNRHWTILGLVDGADLNASPDYNEV